MKKARQPFWSSFQVKLSLAFILSMILVAALSNFLIYRQAVHSQFQQLRDKLKMIAQTAALGIDSEALKKIPLTKEKALGTAAHTIVFEQLGQIRDANPAIWSIYIMGETDRPGILQFLADVDIPDEEEIEEGITYYPGDEYDATRFPAMLEAFEGEATADSELGEDEWEKVLSGYAPVRDKDDDLIGILGVDILANDVYRTQNMLRQRARAVLIVGIVFSLLLGLVMSRSITVPLKRLVGGIDNVAQGDLRYQVEVKGRDEIASLAGAFNQMTKSLYAARRRLNDYFYNVMTSLVRILEEKDKYTKGHSERVAYYAEKIAAKLGLPPPQLRLLKDAALLHDVGKLGIKLDILNKEAKLNDEEWAQIRRHPVVGEEILRPVVLDNEMLLVVRRHHERFDGKGYPDQLSGEDISIFAAIVAVADAYDAMTSSRAYRRALAQQRAREELRKNRGRQFDARVVDAFLAVLQEEG